MDEKKIQEADNQDELLKQAEKIQNDLLDIIEKKEKAKEAEINARQEREEAGKDVAVSGAKVLEAVDIAQVAAQRLDEKESKGLGAKVDAIRATTNLDIAEAEFIRSEREYKETQIRVSKRALRSNILDLRADLKQLEAEQIDIQLHTEQLNTLQKEYEAKLEVENPTSEDIKEREILSETCQELQFKIADLETKKEVRRESIKNKEGELSEEALLDIETELKDEELEYLLYAEIARQARSKVSDSINEARSHEQELMVLEEDSIEPNTVCKDSKLLKVLHNSEHVKKEVLRQGSQVLENRIEDIKSDIEVDEHEGLDTEHHRHTLQALQETQRVQKELAEELEVLKVKGAAKKVYETSAVILSKGIAISETVTSETKALVQDILADVAKFIPKYGTGIHIGLHLSAGIERASGHMAAGLEEVLGLSIQGNSRLDRKSEQAKAEMKLDAAQLGLLDTDGLAQGTSLRHKEVERTIVYDKMSSVMQRAGKQTAQAIMDALSNAGLDILVKNNLVIGAEGLGKFFIDGISINNVFLSLGEMGVQLQDALEKFLCGDSELEKVLGKLEDGTESQAVVCGFIGGMAAYLYKKKLLDKKVYEYCIKPIQSSLNDVKVQSDYYVIGHDENAIEAMRERLNVSEKHGYAHWFDQTGDIEEAKRIARQRGISLRELYKQESENDEEESTKTDVDYNKNNAEDSQEEFEQNEGSSVDVAVSEATSLQGTGSLGTDVEPTLKNTKDKKQVFKFKKVLFKTKFINLDAIRLMKKSKRRIRRILLFVVLIVILLLIISMVLKILSLTLAGVVGSVTTLNQEDNHWGAERCTCGCIEQYFLGGAVPVEDEDWFDDWSDVDLINDAMSGLDVSDGGVAAEAMLSGSLENGGVITFNVPKEVIQIRNGMQKTFYPQQKWCVWEYNGQNLDTRPPYDSEGLPYVIVGNKLLDPNTPDDTRLEGSPVGNKSVYARLVLQQESGKLAVVMARVNTKDVKAHTFNKYPAESTRYGSLLKYENRVTSGGENLKPYVNDKVIFKIPSGLIQTGIAYPNSANAGGYIASDGPWMPAHIDMSTIEFNQAQALKAVRAKYPKSRLLQVQTSTNRVLLESMPITLSKQTDVSEESNDVNATPTIETVGTDGVTPTPTVGTDGVTPTPTVGTDGATPTPTDTVVDGTTPTPIDVTVDEMSSTVNESNSSPRVVCDCPFSCTCYEIHGFENVYRSNGTPVLSTQLPNGMKLSELAENWDITGSFGDLGGYEAISGLGFNLAIESIKAKSGYIVHEDKIPGGVALYLQNEKKAPWYSMDYDVGGKVHSHGCGPTALAIIVSTLCSDRVVSPLDTVPVAISQGWVSGYGAGSNHSIMWLGPQYYGLKSEAILSTDDADKAIVEEKATTSYKSIMDKAKEKLIEALLANKLVFGIFGHVQYDYGIYKYDAKANVFTTRGHFLVIVGITSDHKKVYISDPASLERTKQVWDIDQVLANVSHGLYAISK